MNRDARDLAGGVEPLERGQPPLVRLDAAHVVVGAGPHRDRREDRVDAGVRHRELARAGELVEDLLGPEVPQVEHHRAVDTAAGLDLGRLRARDDVARGQLERVRRVALHEALAVLVDQVAALAAAALGDEDPRRVHRRRVELHELHVLERQAGAKRHRHPVAGAGVGVRRRAVEAPRAAGREDRRRAGHRPSRRRAGGPSRRRPCNGRRPRRAGTRSTPRGRRGPRPSASAAARTGPG